MTNDPLPLDAGDAALLELSALRREIGPLRVIADRAAYVTGPAECVEGDCDHPDQSCPELVEGHATYADVHARDGLEHIIEDLLGQLSQADLAGKAVSASALVTEVEERVYGLACRLDEAPGGDVVQDRPLYRNIIAAEAVRGGAR